jgi:hypothetical protein
VLYVLRPITSHRMASLRIERGRKLSEPFLGVSAQESEFLAECHDWVAWRTGMPAADCPKCRTSRHPLQRNRR